MALNAKKWAKETRTFQFCQCFVKCPYRLHWDEWKHTRKSDHFWIRRGSFLEENTSWVMGRGQVWVGIEWWKPDSLGISPDLYPFLKELTALLIMKTRQTHRKHIIPLWSSLSGGAISAQTVCPVLNRNNRLWNTPNTSNYNCAIKKIQGSVKIRNHLSRNEDECMCLFSAAPSASQYLKI